MTVSPSASAGGQANGSLLVPGLPVPQPDPPDAIWVGVLSFLLLVFLPLVAFSSGSMYQGGCWIYFQV